METTPLAEVTNLSLFISHDQVDKAMFSNLTEEMKQNLETTLPKSAFTNKDDMIPVMAEPKVLQR